VNQTDIAILGADRYIGQLLLTLLDKHPDFKVVQLFAAGDTRIGRYAESVDWFCPESLPEDLAGLELEPLGAALRAPLCLSVLPDGGSARWDRYYTSSGARVVTHAEDLRLAEDVPLLVPELAAGDIAAGRISQLLIASPNCTTTILALPLSVLDRNFGVEAICVTALQAISGGDLGGPRAISLVDNLVPGLAGEEAALSREIGRLFSHAFDVSVHAVRVPVHTGHCLTVSVQLATPASPDDVTAALRDYRAPESIASAWSGLASPIRIVEGAYRPTPRLDAGRDGGMTVSVGAVRRCPVLGIAMTLVGDNMRRGSAGNTLLLAELLTAGPQ